MYQPINLSVENGSIEGYAVPVSSENIVNFLSGEVGGSVGQQVIFVLQRSVDRVAVIKSLHVDEEFRGNGIGAQLVSDFLEASGSDCIVLLADAHESQKDGFDLERFYESFDFEAAYSTPAGPLMIFPVDLAQTVKEYIEKQTTRPTP